MAWKRRRITRRVSCFGASAPAEDLFKRFGFTAVATFHRARRDVDPALALTSPSPGRLARSYLPIGMLRALGRTAGPDRQPCLRFLTSNLRDV